MILNQGFALHYFHHQHSVDYTLFVPSSYISDQGIIQLSLEEFYVEESESEMEVYLERPQVSFSKTSRQVKVEIRRKAMNVATDAVPIFGDAEHSNDWHLKGQVLSMKGCH